ncbi:MAG: hypothetical protein RLY97_606 [Pseudomonadota bacterium]|jgi:hypothetical protein
MIPFSSLANHLRLDRMGVVLSGLCAVHCLAGLCLVMLLGLGGGVLLNPAIHEIGLALALVIGAVTLGFGALRHRRFGILLVGVLGLSLMGAALIVVHGPLEAVLTIIGVALLASAHLRNLRHSH